MMTLLAFVVTLGVLIVVHEYGHYLAAKRCGVRVLQFSIGFGRALYTRRFGRDQTELIVAAVPLGGFVRMLDEREGPVPPELREFEREDCRFGYRDSVFKHSDFGGLAGAVVERSLETKPGGKVVYATNEQLNLAAEPE